MFCLVVAGLALMCTAAPLACLTSLTALSTAHKADWSAQSHFASTPSLLSRAFQSETTASLARTADRPPQAVHFASFESRFSALQPPPPPNVRKVETAVVASAASAMKPAIQFIRFDEPTLAPMAFTQFCLKYPAECKPQRSRDDRVELNTASWLELEDVNHGVNASIQPERNREGLAGEKWVLGPPRGDCNDYAVTKRHQLMSRGWPARDLLLSEVVTVAGEHHLVMVVRTSGGDLVLDNLTDQIVPWSRTTYRWVRIQTPKDPNYWSSVSKQSA